jgi:CHAD domain-containing protein
MQLYDRCGKKPTRKRVHALRVVTLRILAELESRIGEERQGNPQIESAARWMKLGEKLREMLGPVREADVWLGELDGLQKSLADTNGYRVRSNRGYLRQIDALKGRLRQKRRQSEKELVAEIAERLDKFAELTDGVEPLFEQSMAITGGRQIAERFARVVKEFPALDAANLHEFRKRIKTVRYLAEIVARQDAEAGRQASLLRKMQSAIGDWHDWQVLAKREGQAQGKRAELTALLEMLAAESLEKALAVCERLTESLLKKSDDIHTVMKAPTKKPPVGAEQTGWTGVIKSA